MLNSPKEVRVFLSSTFRDLNQEREVLMKKIFPDIKAVCRLKGITVTEVDLRWGITDEEATLGRIVRTCMEEIDRCRPYFIGFLGGRYGYIPDYVEISKDPLLLHDYAWIEDAVFDELSITEMEFRYGGLDEQGKYAPDVPVKPQPLFYFKQIETPNEDTDRINALREVIEQKGYEPKFYQDAEGFGKMVYDDFIALMERDFPDARQETELDRLRSFHRAFADSRRRSYIPNMQYIKQLNEFVQPTASGSKMLVYAPSGAGKSSLMAFWADMVKKRNPNLFVVEHYVGIGSKFNDHYDIITHLLHEIKEKTGIDRDIPTQQNRLENAVSVWLPFLKNQPTLWIIDSLDQLSAASQNLSWLPALLPPNVVVVLSSNAQPFMEKWQQTGQPLLTIAPITEREREAITVRYLSEYGKSLPAELVKYLAKDEKNASPLFLRVLLEELRLHGQHESLAQYTNLLLSCPNTAALFEQVLNRLEGSFQPDVVKSVLVFIWVSRFGLNEEELAEVSNLPRIQISALLSAFDYHLLRRNGLITYFHQYLRNAVEKRYLSHEHNTVAVFTQLLVTYFEKEVNNSKNRYLQLIQEPDSNIISDVIPEVRHIKELAWLLEYANDLDRLHQLVSIPEILTILNAPPNYTDLLRIWAVLEKAGFSMVTTYENMIQFTTRNQYPHHFVVEVLRCVDNLFSSAGHYTHAISVNNQLLEVAGKTSDEYIRSIAHAKLGASYSNNRQFEQALEHLNIALKIAQEQKNVILIISILGNIGNTHFYMGQLEEAIQIYTEIARLQEENKLLHKVINNNISLGSAYINLGNFDQALYYLEKGLQISEEQGDLVGQGHLQINIGITYDMASLYPQAIAYLEKGANIVEHLGLKQLHNTAIGALGKVYHNMGNFEKAKVYLYQSLYSAMELHDEIGVSIEKGWLSFIYEQEGNHAKAYEYIEEAIQVPRRIGQVLEEVYWLSEKHTYLYRQALKSPAEQKNDLLLQSIQTLQEATACLSKISNRAIEMMIRMYETVAHFALCPPDDHNRILQLIEQMETLLLEGENDYSLPMFTHQQLWLMYKVLPASENKATYHYAQAASLYKEKETKISRRAKVTLAPLLRELAKEEA